MLADSFRKLEKGVYSDHGIAAVAELPCYRFGVNGFAETPKQVISSYRKRGPYSAGELEQVKHLINESSTFCARFGHHDQCLPRATNGRKSIYFPNNDIRLIRPDIHHPTHGQREALRVKPIRNQGMNCNHMWLRSIDHVHEKARKHLIRLYKDIAAIPLGHIYHNLTSSIQDLELFDLAEMLKQRNGTYMQMTSSKGRIDVNY